MNDQHFHCEVEEVLFHQDAFENVELTHSLCLSKGKKGIGFGHLVEKIGKKHRFLLHHI